MTGLCFGARVNEMNTRTIEKECSSVRLFLVKRDEATGFAKDRKPTEKGRACVFVKCRTWKSKYNQMRVCASFVMSLASIKLRRTFLPSPLILLSFLKIWVPTGSHS